MYNLVCLYCWVFTFNLKWCQNVNGFPASRIQPSVKLSGDNLSGVSVPTPTCFIWASVTLIDTDCLEMRRASSYWFSLDTLLGSPLRIPGWRGDANLWWAEIWSASVPSYKLRRPRPFDHTASAMMLFSVRDLLLVLNWGRNWSRIAPEILRLRTLHRVTLNCCVMCGKPCTGSHKLLLPVGCPAQVHISCCVILCLGSPIQVRRSCCCLWGALHWFPFISVALSMGSPSSINLYPIPCGHNLVTCM